jgi:YVTN family beta-propeller protein
MLMINSVTATITVGTNPSAISINPSTNTVYVANQNTNTVSVIDGKTNSVTAIPIKL